MTTRDAILDGALRAMRSRGLARATTKEIARAAGFSEATLYKFFGDKVDLFLAVLAERLPRVTVLGDGIAGMVGSDTVAGNLSATALELERFFRAVLPIAMSLFSDRELLARHRDAVHARGGGPEVLERSVRDYLAAEQAIGRVRADAPVAGASMALVGAAMHHAFLARFEADETEADAPPAALRAFADGVAQALLPALLP